MKPKVFLSLVAALVVAVVTVTFLWPRQEGVTLYCAVDDVHAIPILDAFEARTGIHIHRNFDTEANKTVGLVAKLREERANPRADVFWNNEIMHTIRLAREGVLTPYASDSAKDIPDALKDADALWTGFAARARILIVNTELLPDQAEHPTSMQDLLAEPWKGRTSFVRPLTGTTLTHAAVLYTVLGDDGARDWFKGMHANGTVFPSGNGQLARAVAGGQSTFGFTDTDDFEKVRRDGRPVAKVYPDQGEGQPGTLLIPNTIGLVKGGPRPDLGQQLIDFLLSREVEAMLAAGDSAQIPVRSDVARPPSVIGPPTFRTMVVDWNDVVENFDQRLGELEALWRP